MNNNEFRKDAAFMPYQVWSIFVTDKYDLVYLLTLFWVGASGASYQTKT